MSNIVSLPIAAPSMGAVPLRATRPTDSEIARLPTDEALYYGAAYAHISQFRERERMARIKQQVSLAARRRTAPRLSLFR